VSPMQQHLLLQEIPGHMQEQHAIEQRMAPSTVVVSFTVDTLQRRLNYFCCTASASA
jgi:hypothetical protein